MKAIMDAINIHQTSCLAKRCCSGTLDQKELVMRYILIKKRIDNLLTRDDLAFLLGKTPSFVNDYEELALNAKCNNADLFLLCKILDRFIMFDFHKAIRDIIITNEKRLVRVVRKEFINKIEYEFIHPWTSTGLRELKVVEPVFTGNNQQEADFLIKQELLQLIKVGYFNRGKSSYEIYHHIWQTFINQSHEWRPIALKHAIYFYVRNNHLKIESSRGQFIFLTKLKNTFS